MEVPARGSLYQHMLQVIRAYRLSAIEVIAHPDAIKSLEQAHIMNYPGLTRVPLCLPAVGCDAAIADSVAFYRYRQDGMSATYRNGIESGTVGAHDLISLSLSLYQDGSPYVPPGFSLDVALANNFYVFAGREMPPVMYQSAESEEIAAVWHMAQRIELGDSDCTALIRLFSELPHPWCAE